MRIFVAGATGAIGRYLVPKLVEGGHEVVGLTRREAGRARLREMGAAAVVADALDREGIARAVADAEPDVLVHQLTALSGSLDMRHFDRDFEPTNRLRTAGTDHLLSAARESGVRRFVAQSFAGWPYARTGGAVRTEEDPLDPDPLPAMRRTHAAIRHLEEAVTGPDWTEGIVLRYGAFYGPGTSIALDPDGQHVALIRRRAFPVVGGGTGVWSFVHVGDAAAAAVGVVERGRPGLYNIVDDEPAPVAEWLPALAAAVGAKRPFRLPRWLGRIVAGRVAVTLMTEVRGASNAKARAELGWRPRYPSWRQGFAEGLR